MTSATGTRHILISSVALAVAIFVAVIMLASRSTSSGMDESSSTNASSGGMSGMDHGSGDVPGMAMPGMDSGSGSGEATPSTPTPTPSMAADMPGMDSGSGDAHGTSPGHSSMAGEATAARPLAPVLGTFGGGTSAVLLAAGFLRRRDRAANQAKQAARAARRSAK